MHYCCSCTVWLCVLLAKKLSLKCFVRWMLCIYSVGAFTNFILKLYHSNQGDRLDWWPSEKLKNNLKFSKFISKMKVETQKLSQFFLKNEIVVAILRFILRGKVLNLCIAGDENWFNSLMLFLRSYNFFKQILKSFTTERKTAFHCSAPLVAGIHNNPKLIDRRWYI